MKCLRAGLLAIVAIAGGGLWLDSWVAPSAKVPCDPAFAETLDADLAAVGRPAGVAAPGPSDFDGGHCEDDDGGGVSLSWASYRPDLPVADVAGYYETSLREHGWSGEVTHGVRFSRAPVVCAWRAVPRLRPLLRAIGSGSQKVL